MKSQLSVSSRPAALAQAANMNGPMIFTWFLWVVCLGIILTILASLVIQFVVRPLRSRLVLIKDIPLPGALPDIYRTGNYSFGLNTHTVAVDPVTHDVYLPVPRLGHRPVLRIMHYYAADRPRAVRTAHTPRRPGPSSAARAGRTQTASVHPRVPPGRRIPNTNEAGTTALGRLIPGF